MIRALVFDFDGLILETEIPVFQSWQELFAAHGLELPFEKWALNIGTADEVFAPQAVLESHLKRELQKEELERRWRREMELIADQPPLPGVVEYLQDAQRLGLRVGLASSSSCGWVTGHLERLGLSRFFHVVQAKDDVPRTKPDPALYRTTVELLGALPEQAVAFEDSPNGILAAKRAGLHCVVVPNLLTRLLDTSQADLCLRSLAEMKLEEVLGEFEN
jgi:HAD superfamily hydrolase (TIGR01509 family)